MNQQQLAETVWQLSEEIAGTVEQMRPITDMVGRYKQALVDIQFEIDSRETVVVESLVSHNGFKGLGSNQQERDHAIKLALLKDDGMDRLHLKYSNYADELAKSEAEYKQMSRLYGSLCYRLQAATSLLQFYSGAVGANPNGSHDMHEVNREALAGL